jgi:hypothetical protein
MNISLEQLTAIPYLDLKGWTPSRDIQSLNFYVNNEWHCWFAADGQLHKMNLLPVESDFFGDKPARPTDQIFPFLNLNAQRASFPEMRLASRGIWNDFQDLGTSLAKINLFYELWKERQIDAERFVQTEVEFIVMVCRGVFDLLQEMIRAHWKRIELFDKSRKKKNLPKSFADVVLHGNTPQTGERIASRYGLPDAFATWYTSQTDVFVVLRKLRNDLNHGGSRAVTTVFSTDRGFAIHRKDKPWCELYDWPQEVELPNDLVPIRPALCSMIYRTIESTSSFANVFENTIQLPKPLCPGLEYFSRGRSDRQLWEMAEVVKNSWWCDTHAELPEWEEVSPFEKPL